MKLWNNSRIIGSFCFVFERTNSPNKKTIFGWVILLYLNYPLNLFLNLEDFLCPFSGSYLSAHTKQNLSIHSISENGRKPVKKISASATVLLTLKVEVQSPYNRITISYNRKGHRAFAVFLCRFLLESAVGLFLICGVVLRLSIWIFTFQKFRWEVFMVKYAPRKVYIRESGGYVELSYTEFCRCRESDQTYMDKLFIPIQGCLLEVVREQYTDFYRDKERWRYLQKLDTKNRLLSLDGFARTARGILWTLSLMKRWTLQKPLSMRSWWTG